MNVFFRAEHMVPAIQAAGVTGLVRSPLAMGIFGGKYDAGTQFKADDVRGTDEGWMAYFQDGKIKDTHLAQLNGVRDVLTSGGRRVRFRGFGRAAPAPCRSRGFARQNR